MNHPTLDLGDDLSGIALIPAPVERLGHGAELDDQAGREILGLDLAALLTPQAQQGVFVSSHDDPGVRTSDKAAPVG